MLRLFVQEDAINEAAKFLCKDILYILKQYLFIEVDIPALETLLHFHYSYLMPADRYTVYIHSQIDTKNNQYIQVTKERGYDGHDADSIIDMIQNHPIIFDINALELIVNIKYDEIIRVDSDGYVSFKLLQNESYSIKNWRSDMNIQHWNIIHHKKRIVIFNVFYLLNQIAQGVMLRHNYRGFIGAPKLKQINTYIVDGIGYVLKIEIDYFPGV